MHMCARDNMYQRTPLNYIINQRWFFTMSKLSQATLEPLFFPRLILRVL